MLKEKKGGDIKMNKRIIACAATIFFICLAAGNSLAMENDRPTCRICMRSMTGQSRVLDIEYIPQTQICPSSYIYAAAGKAFGLEPGTFNIIMYGKLLPEAPPQDISIEEIKGLGELYILPIKKDVIEKEKKYEPIKIETMEEKRVKEYPGYTDKDKDCFVSLDNVLREDKNFSFSFWFGLSVTMEGQKTLEAIIKQYGKEKVEKTLKSIGIYLSEEKQKGMVTDFEARKEKLLALIE